MRIINFLRNWTLPVAIAVGSAVYLTFYCVPQLDALGNALKPVVDVLFPLSVFMTLFITFCKVDYHQMRPHRWHVGVLMAQLLLVALIVAIILWMKESTANASLFAGANAPFLILLLEAMLTCIIGPAASASPVVVGKLGGNISTMTTYVIISALASAVMIPLVFPLLEQTVHVEFLSACLIILQKVSTVLLLPLVLGWLVQHHMAALQRRIAAMPNLGFYCWAVSLSITTGITVKNIVHSEVTPALLLSIAAATLMLCGIQFVTGRAIGRLLDGKHPTGNGPTPMEVNAGQALFQKNTALSIWVAYMYLSPVASIGAGCYVLWQNIINSIELWQYQRRCSATANEETDTLNHQG